MISRNGQGGFFSAHWDWIVAGGGVLAAIVAGVLLSINGGTDPEDAASEAVRTLSVSPRKGTGVAAMDMSEFDRALQLAQKPQTVPIISETGASFLVSGRRVFCELCHKPIPGDLKTCPLCKQDQPEPEKVVLDTDGDGIPDDDELKLGLDPNDPSDAEGDPDGDGFSTLEELAAKTNPKDKTSHPDYLDDLAIRLPLKETVLPFFFEKVEQLPGGQNRYYFRDPKAKNDYGGRGRQYNPLEGEEIGKTGFVVKGYEKKSVTIKIAATKTDKALSKKKDSYLVTIERTADGKSLQLVDDEKRKPVDVQAVLEFSRGEAKTFTVVPGDEITLFDEKYKVTEIKKDGKSVKVSVQNLASGKFRTLETLEQ